MFISVILVRLVTIFSPLTNPTAQFFSGYTVFFTGAWSAADFITNYLPVMMFPVLWIGYKLIRRTKMVRKEEMDFYTGIEEIEAESYDEPPSKNLLEKIWRSIM